MRFYFTAMTRNKKLGPMPVVTASRNTCSLKCSLYDAGCYALTGPLWILWQSLGTIGIDFKALLRQIRLLRRGTVWRYGQAGDLPPNRNDKLELAKANAGRPVICFSHDRDFDTLREMSQLGFNVNLSADSLEEADELAATGLPTVVVIESRYKRLKTERLSEYRQRLGGSLKLRTPSGRPVAICPETYVPRLTCLDCQLCTKPRTRDAIIAFPAHGTQKGVVDKRLQGVSHDKEYRHQTAA